MCSQNGERHWEFVIRHHWRDLYLTRSPKDDIFAEGNRDAVVRATHPTKSVEGGDADRSELL